MKIPYKSKDGYPSRNFAPTTLIYLSIPKDFYKYLFSNLFSDKQRFLFKNLKE